MAEPIRSELKTQHRIAVLVSVPDPTRKLGKEQALDELKGLAKTAGVRVVGTLVQNRGKPHPSTCLGKGKLEELKELVEATGAELIIFDNNLTPAQGRNLEQETNRIIVDRSELILDIFASHARTKESKLQVELAQLQYTRTRLKRMWTHLERIDGGIGASKGPGEKQIETDRRLINHRITELKSQLKEIELRRERLVLQRDGHALVSIVGYTNAGKSTLMNALTGADVLIANQLFATLETRTRKWPIPGMGSVLLSDTVGFVRDLPHELVASFRSTLEEAKHADLLLHVVDASNPEAEQQAETVVQVLDEIGINATETILVLNKIDAASDQSLLDVLRSKFPISVSVSAVDKVGLDQLADKVSEILSKGTVELLIDVSLNNGRLQAFLAKNSQISSVSYDDSSAHLRCRISRTLVPRLQSDPDVLKIEEVLSNVSLTKTTDISIG